MAKRDDVSSTEQLLELIRTEEAAPPVQGVSERPLTEKGPKLISMKPLTSKRGMVIGIDFGEDALKVVKVRRHSDRQWDLLAHKTIAYPPELRPGNEEIEDFLKENLRKILKELAPFTEKCELWAILSSPNADARLVQIPKTPHKQIANAAYWTFKKEVPATDLDRDVFDFEILGEAHEGGTTVSQVFGYRVLKSEVDKLVQIFSDVGRSLTGVCLAPFAVQNLIRTRVLPFKDRVVATLLVDANWAFVEIFSSRNLVLSRAIKTGRNRLLEDVLDRVKQTVPPQLALEGEAPSQSPMDMQFAGVLLRGLCFEGDTIKAGPEGLEIEKEDIFQMILPSLNRLVRKVDTGLEYYIHKLGKEEVSRVFIGGEIAFSGRVVAHIQEEIQRPCETLDPFTPQNDRLKMMCAPPSTIEKGSCLKALGAALSHSSWTPNLLLTYEQREMEKIRRRTGLAILGSFIAAILICFGFFLWQAGGLAENNRKLNTLAQELAQCRLLVDKKRMLELAIEIRDKRHLQKQYSEKYKGMALMGELSRITPANIRLLDANVQLGKPAGVEEKAPPLKIVLEGLVLGERQHLESSLTGYLVKLEGQPLFKQPTIKKSQIAPHEGIDALHFTAEMEIL